MTRTTLILVRHGETLGNRHGRFQTYNTPLSDEGRRQAALLGERLAAEGPIDALYSSDLGRAHETATIVGERLGLTPVSDRALRELDVGDWKGLLRSEVAERHAGGFEGWLAAGGEMRLPGDAGECCDDVAARVTAWLERVLAQHPGERVVAVSHGLTLMILLAVLQELDPREALRTRTVGQGNTAVNIVEVDAAGARRCLLLGCTAHLDAPSVESRAV
jgi:broad specificity phosphatase PhoE